MGERILHERESSEPGGGIPLARTEVIVACQETSPRLGAIIVGAFVGIAVMIILGTFGSAVGTTAGTLAERKAQKEKVEPLPGIETPGGDDLRNPAPEVKSARQEAAKGI